CLLFFVLRGLPSSTLFPYTTLFRSASNYITSGGDLFIAGDFTLSGLTITDNGTLTTIASTDGNQLVLDSDTGSISVGDNALVTRSEEHTSELQSRENLVCRLLLEKK